MIKGDNEGVNKGGTKMENGRKEKHGRKEMREREKMGEDGNQRGRKKEEEWLTAWP